MVVVPVMLQRMLDLGDEAFEGRDFSDLKIIFVSGYAEDAFEKNLPDDHGKFHFLPKPFTLKQLVAAVKETMAA